MVSSERIKIQSRFQNHLPFRRTVYVPVVPHALRQRSGCGVRPAPGRGCPLPHRKSFPISRSFHFSLSILILLLQSSPPAAQTSLSLPPILSFSTGRTVLLFFSSFNLSHYIKKGQHRIIRPSPLHCSFCSPDGEREGKFPLFGFLHVKVLAQILVSERSGALLGPVETILSGPLRPLLLGSRAKMLTFPQSVLRGLFPRLIADASYVRSF